MSDRAMDRHRMALLRDHADLQAQLDVMRARVEALEAVIAGAVSGGELLTVIAEGGSADAA